MSHHFYYDQQRRREQTGPRAAVIKYDEGETPRVTAKGSGEIAKQILSLAKEHDIHMQEDPSLLESLLDMDLGENVPPQLYSVIAEVLLLIEEMEKEY